MFEIVTCSMAVHIAYLSDAIIFIIVHIQHIFKNHINWGSIYYEDLIVDQMHNFQHSNKYSTIKKDTPN